ncbi:MAG: roadblock/LC7 domain-containing protein [Candidatus Njordarchaeia archaeon]
MIKGEIEKHFQLLKQENKKVIGIIVTDDSGLLVYSNPNSSSSEFLGGTIVAVLKKIDQILRNFGASKIETLSLRIEDYNIDIIPKERTITIIISKK